MQVHYILGTFQGNFITFKTRLAWVGFKTAEGLPASQLAWPDADAYMRSGSGSGSGCGSGKSSFKNCFRS